MGEIVLAVIVIVLAILLMWPVVSAWRFALLFPPRGTPAGAETFAPRAAVILCLRGADPSLPACLNGLLAQHYPNHALWIIVDSRIDPAWDVVHRLLAELRPSVPVHVRELKVRRETCSLKLSAQLQILEELNDSYEVVAFIDADVVAAPDWLHALIQPLKDSQVGVCTGIRWYAPAARNLGTLVRYFWNAGACTQMYALDIPWGGSLAFRADCLRQSGLLEQWAHSFGEDTSAPAVLWRHGLRVQIVPAATMVCQETSSLASCFTFIRRQIVSVRLHHPRWPQICAISWGSAIGMAGALALLPVAYFTEHLYESIALAAGLAGMYFLGQLAALLWVERAIRRMTSPQMPGFPLSLRTLLALPLTLALQLSCLVSGARLHRIDWRGVTYELGKNGTIRLVEYRPYEPSKASDDPHASVI
jgi:hypothetical protein